MPTCDIVLDISVFFLSRQYALVSEQNCLKFDSGDPLYIACLYF